MRIHLPKTLDFGLCLRRVMRQAAQTAMLMLTLTALLAVEGRAQPADSNSLTREQLEQLVAPIALYPDALLDKS